MDSASGHQLDEKASATIPPPPPPAAAATVHGEFLLHLLRRGNNINNQTKEDVFTDNIKSDNKPTAAASSSSSSSSVAEAWQLTDPAVAALGPSHTFQNPNPKPLQNPNVWLHSLNGNNKDQSLQLPLSLPVDQSAGASYLNPHPLQNPTVSGTRAGAGAGAAAAHWHFYGSGGNVHGHLGIRPHSSPWMRGGVEGSPHPYGHTGGSEGESNHGGDAWQLQKHKVDLQELSKSSRGGLGFPLGGFVEPRANAVSDNNERLVGGYHSSHNVYQNCVQGKTSARRLEEKRNRISANDGSISHTTPVSRQACMPIAQEQSIGDGNLQFGSVTWHSQHLKHNPINDIHLHDRNKFELNSGDIFFNNAELPPNLQGKNGVVRFLCRPSSNQQGCVNPTVLGEGATWEGSKAQVVEPRVSKGSVASFEQGILKGKAEAVRGSRNTVCKETTGFAVNNASYRDHRKKEWQVQTSLEIGRDSNLNRGHHNGCGRLDPIRRDGITNGVAQAGITKARYIIEPAKGLTQIRTDGEDMENHSSQSGDGDAFKKCRGSQQEWRVKQSRIDGLMQSGNLDSFSTITGYLSALDVNRSDSCTFNDVSEKHLPKRICRPDNDSSCCHPLPVRLENLGPSAVQAMEDEQYHKELVEGAISEGSQRFAVERRMQVKQRADLTRCKSEGAHKEAASAVDKANPMHLRPVCVRDRYHNRNNSALSRVYKDLDSNTGEGMLMRKQYQRHELMKRRQKEFQYRVDLEVLTPGFLSLYESLIPQEEEKTKRKQLISSLEKLINRQWPGAQLHLFGSCANAFGVSKSDIDVCLSIDYEPSSKAELVLKLAEILQAEDMQNVQALTHARVPIVKFSDPVTCISCDICINNILAVVNTKLLHDYSQIDVRLLQLAFMVKHWAKCRRINETYQGTLSSYAYVLLCIHFLQQRKPAIIPCLQEMKATYQVTIGEIVCSYYDKVNELKHYGAGNKETLGQLLSAFFDYWAFRHDYANSVISVRTGGLLSKNEKDWTRRIGNERHLICIEDPFEISHDLGRVVDKHSIRVLKEEFQRAAEIMLYDPDPRVTLFKPYVPS